MKYLSTFIAGMFLAACSVPNHQYASYISNRDLTRIQIGRIEQELTSMLRKYKFSSDIWNLNAGINHDQNSDVISYWGKVSRLQGLDDSLREITLSVHMDRSDGRINISENVRGPGRELTPEVSHLCGRIAQLLDGVVGRGSYRIEFKAQGWHFDPT